MHPCETHSVGRRRLHRCQTLPPSTTASFFSPIIRRASFHTHTVIRPSDESKQVMPRFRLWVCRGRKRLRDSVGRVCIKAAQPYGKRRFKVDLRSCGVESCLNFFGLAWPPVVTAFGPEQQPVESIVPAPCDHLPITKVEMSTDAGRGSSVERSLGTARGLGGRDARNDD